MTNDTYQYHSKARDTVIHVDSDLVERIHEIATRSGYSMRVVANSLLAAAIENGYDIPSRTSTRPQAFKN